MKSNIAPIKIIYVDNDSDDLALFQSALEEAKLKAELLTIPSGSKLLKYLATHDAQLPDIIFLDVHMPYISGKECLKKIRSNHALKNIPVIMFSISSYKADIEETFADGANRYIPKSVFFADIVVMLKELFTPGWQENLLKHDKKKFVVHQITV